jgi:phosphatidylinositol glycan class C protein
MASERRWKKILYEDQGVPDDYVDSSFLDEMKKNLNIRTYDFWSVVRESGVVTQQLCSVCAFVVLYVYMTEQWISPQRLFGFSSAITIVGYLLNVLVSQPATSVWCHVTTGLTDLKTIGVFLTFGLGLSPILMTLTESVSTDTIYAMTFFMLLANLLFHDYGTNAAVVSQSLSLNAAIFASVCLASRLPTMWHAFTTVTLAVEIFVLWPVLHRNLKLRVPNVHVGLTLVLGVGTTFAIVTVSAVSAVLFALLCLFVTFVCPAWLLWLQPFKNNIHGPWDEAVVRQ